MIRQARFASIGFTVVATIVVMSHGLTFATPSNRKASAATTCPHDGELRTYQQWRQTVTFPYVAPEAKLHRVKDNYNQVEVGSSKEEVIKAFGSPDFEQEMYPKEPNRPCIGYAFTYYFEKPEDLVNELRDKKIEVFFTPSGNVKWIVGNVGLPEKGGPAHRE